MRSNIVLSQDCSIIGITQKSKDMDHIIMYEYIDISFSYKSSNLLILIDSIFRFNEASHKISFTLTPNKTYTFSWPQNKLYFYLENTFDTVKVDWNNYPSFRRQVTDYLKKQGDTICEEIDQYPNDITLVIQDLKSEIYFNKLDSTYLEQINFRLNNQTIVLKLDLRNKPVTLYSHFNDPMDSLISGFAISFVKKRKIDVFKFSIKNNNSYSYDQQLISTNRKGKIIVDNRGCSKN